MIVADEAVVECSVFSVICPGVVFASIVVFIASGALKLANTGIASSLLEA
jgi:hypothetical protein